MKAIPVRHQFAGCFCRDEEAVARARVAWIGLPDDSRSSFRRGPAAAPAAIRHAYDGRCYNPCTETGVDLENRVVDRGDVPAAENWEETARSYQSRAGEAFRSPQVPFFVGGDHAVTVPVVRALEVLEHPVWVVQIDAHGDLYPEFGGSPDSHACMAVRVLEMEHVERLVQVGVRTLNPTQRGQVERFGGRIEIIEARSAGWPLIESIPSGASVYVSVDVDGFDPSFAPGVSHPVPGGLTPRQVFDWLHESDFTLVGMDVVEVNPSLDVNNLTAILAARLLLEAMGKVLGRADR